MQSPSVTGLFCEDIREEKSGQDTLIGILPDNVHVPTIPGMLPKLAIYIRIHLDASLPPPKSMTAKLVAADESEIALPSWNSSVITKGFSDAESNATPLVGLVLKAAIAPFPFSVAGFIVAKVTIDGTDYIASNLKIAAISASVSSPPA